MGQHCMEDRDARIHRLEDKNKYTSSGDLGVRGAALHGRKRCKITKTRRHYMSCMVI